MTDDVKNMKAKLAAYEAFCRKLVVAAEAASRGAKSRDDLHAGAREYMIWAEQSALQMLQDPLAAPGSRFRL
jgi:hypothetical protein